VAAHQQAAVAAVVAQAEQEFFQHKHLVEIQQ
jgi:hypothetical protein